MQVGVEIPLMVSNLPGRVGGVLMLHCQEAANLTRRLELVLLPDLQVVTNLPRRLGQVLFLNRQIYSSSQVGWLVAS